MSREALIQVVERAGREPAFWDQLVSNSESALAAYDLTAEEHAALLSGDLERLHSLGVDPQVTKLVPWTTDFSAGH